MDKALACHTGNQGSNPDRTKKLIVLISSQAPCHVHSLPHCRYVLQHEYLEVKEKNRCKNPCSAMQELLYRAARIICMGERGKNVYFHLK